MSQVSILMTALMTAFISLCDAGTTAAVAGSDDAKLAFNSHCRNCHSFKKGDNRLGPSLYGILGTKAGQVAGYRGYSGGLTGFTWDKSILDRFIANPASVSPGTSMNYPPVADPAQRAKIIEFLESQVSP